MGTLWVGKEREKKVRKQEVVTMNQRTVNDRQENQKSTLWQCSLTVDNLGKYKSCKADVLCGYWEPRCHIFACTCIKKIVNNPLKCNIQILVSNVGLQCIYLEKQLQSLCFVWLWYYTYSGIV